MSEVIYKNKDYSIEERALNLLKQMTLEEKVAQTLFMYNCQVQDENGVFNEDKFLDVTKHGMGAYYKASEKLNPKENAVFTNRIQKLIMENTRLGIPIFLKEECLHGMLAKGATVFPQAIAMSCSWDEELIYEIYSAVAKETRSRGGNFVSSPVLDIGDDPRWGRIEETFGEDPYLTSQYAKKIIKAFQGEEEIIDEEHIVAMPKHFAGYAQSRGGRNFGPVSIGERELRDRILPPFKAAVEAGALGMMASHNEIDGIPSHGDKKLLTNILRDEWGFKGVVVSDMDDVNRLDIFHHVAGNTDSAVKRGIESGVDLENSRENYNKMLVDLVKKGELDYDVLDKTVLRILYVKFRLGLFDHPYIDENKADKTVNCIEHKNLAKKASDKSIVLLKNNDHILPLNPKDLKNIAVIGPNAYDIHLGTYTASPFNGVSVFEGIKNGVGDNVEVSYSKGCEITAGAEFVENETGAIDANANLIESNQKLIDEAVSTAKASDLIVVCVGGNEFTAREAFYMGNVYGDRAELELPGQQNELIENLSTLNIPIVAVVIGGRPLSFNLLNEKVDAILQGFYLGQATGLTVSDVLFGKVNPGGKLTVTIPRKAGQLPVYYNQKSSGEFKKYLFEDNTPLYPFGYGLSYTQFEYKNLCVTKKVSKNDVVNVTVDVTNSGKYEGDEIVQLYIHDMVSSVTTPRQQLKGFKRITLKPGETKKVAFCIKPEDLSFTGEDYKKTIESGEFEVMVGGNSRDYMSDQFILE